MLLTTSVQIAVASRSAQGCTEPDESRIFDNLWSNLALTPVSILFELLILFGNYLIRRNLGAAVEFPLVQERHFSGK